MQMTNYLSLLVACALIISCNTSANREAETTKKDSATSTSNANYAYTKIHPVDWEWGSEANTQMVLNSLKAFETGNIDESVKAFADTVKIEVDHYEAKVSRDSLAAMFKRERSGMKNMQIKMDDYESVKSKDGKTEFVSLWFKQIFEDQKGKTDSIELMDDLKIENGKVALLNEKVRHYPTGKM
jgi:hypothetical protein